MLEHRGGANGDAPFRFAVKELVARRVLQAHPARGGWFSGPLTRYVLVDGPLIDAELAPVLEPVRSAYRGARRRSMKRLSDGSRVTGVAMRDLLKDGRRGLGGTDGYRDLHVRPALVGRGLLEPPSFDWTASGREADELLQEWLALSQRDLARLTTSDLLSGAQLVAGAGCALLLLEDRHRELGSLGRRLQQAFRPGGGEGAVELDLSRSAGFFALANTFAMVGPAGDGGGAGGGG